MITLTDGNKTIVLTKQEMELIEDGLRAGRVKYAVSITAVKFNDTIDKILTKLEGLKYE